MGNIYSICEASDSVIFFIQIFKSLTIKHNTLLTFCHFHLLQSDSEIHGWEKKKGKNQYMFKYTGSGNLARGEEWLVLATTVYLKAQQLGQNRK